MSVSFMWEVVKPRTANSFNSGTSSDIKALREHFGSEVGLADLPKLRAMHSATHHAGDSLWSEMADLIERLTDGDEDIKIRIWTEF